MTRAEPAGWDTGVPQRYLLDRGWRFHPGELDSPLPNTHTAAYMNHKSGYARGAAGRGFDDSDWRTVDLPHDWSIQHPRDPSHHVDASFLPRGIGWYRRHFRLDPADADRRVAIEFDGVATHCTVWVNGHLLHRNFGGYTPFVVDFTDVARFGDQHNTVAVRVDATYVEGWWYEGAGIYRHVWLIRSAPVHFRDDGVAVRPLRTAPGRWEVQIHAEVGSIADARFTGMIEATIDDAAGRQIGAATAAVECGARSSAVVVATIGVDRPGLWSPETPVLYRARCRLVAPGGEPVDVFEASVGFRTLRFDPDSGFFLNDVRTPLLGTCNHQDHAGVGVALPDSLHTFRIRRLRDMGCNAYRCSHHPPARELLEACDRLGMMVMDESRTFDSSPIALQQLEAMVRRDRNHPSVILWSLCNEESIQTSPQSFRIARTMASRVRELDPTRPVTAAVSGGLLNDGCIGDALDVMGINYQLHLHDQYHAKFPQRPVFAAETNSVISTRGQIADDADRCAFADDDTRLLAWSASARTTWRHVKERPWLAGLFIWTGFDYRGEPSPLHWPCVNSHFGLLDLCGFEKNGFWRHKAYFTTEPMIHLSTHWTWPGREAEEIPVTAISNGEEAELFLNGRSLGRRAVDAVEFATWAVRYEPGTLRAVAYRGGAVAAEHVVETAGETAGLALTRMDDQIIRADGAYTVPVAVAAIDTAGRFVPTADRIVQFSITGPGRILGVGNGDPASHESDRATSRRLFNGLAQVLVQTTRAAGAIRLFAAAEGVPPASLELLAVPIEPSPEAPPAEVRWFIVDWRRSPVSTDRPDPTQSIEASDMNTWERVQLTPTSHATHDRGFAMLRAPLKLPRVIARKGGELVFDAVAGQVEVYLDARRVADADRSTPGSLRVPLPPDQPPAAITVLIRSTDAPAGVVGAVAVIGVSDR